MQLEDRKTIERAKGVLMTARGLSEDEAFTLLRSTAMHVNLRLPELARGVIEAARWAEAVNRSGQLRMLSQRLVKLLAQRLADVDPRGARRLQDEAAVRVQDTLAYLRELARATPEAPAWAPALEQVTQAWEALREALEQRLGAASLRRADERAEALLAAAESLTGTLEVGSQRRSLRMVNACGRLRMVTQRVAKQALMGATAPAAGTSAPGVDEALLDQFATVLVELERAPLSTPDIRARLTAASDEWQRLLRGLRGLPREDALAGVAHSGDQLLEMLDALTADYEHSLQVILS